MKLSHFYLLFFLFIGLVACSEDEEPAAPLESAEPPSELDLDFSIARDNSGTVTILPNGTAVTLYRVFFGDGTETATELSPGNSVDHVYEEGVYTLSLEAMGINGAVTTFTKDLTVSLLPAENLLVTVTPTIGVARSIDVSATADLETNFEVYFGEDPDQEAVVFEEGEIVSYAYGEDGSYELRVVAVSGGSASVEYTETVVISNPLVLPVDFENIEIEFGEFGGATGSIIDNPGPDAINGSSQVGRLNKEADSEPWAGIFFDLGEAVDFTSLDKIRIKSWSPAAGVPIILKIENILDNEIAVEVTTNTTVAGQWEELIFDFSGEDLSLDVQRLVLFYDFGTAGSGQDYYFDDVEQTDGSAEIGLPLNFEAGDIEFEFEGFGGATAEVIDNPDQNGNSSDRVGASTKMFGSETWGGVFIDLADPINFSNGTTFNLKVWSVTAGAEVLLKLENPDNPDVEIEVMTPTVGSESWETVSFDFSGIDPSNNYTRVAFFFDFGTPGDEQTYYFDDLELVQ